MNKLGFHVNWVKSEALSAIEKVKPLVIKTLHHDVDFWKQVREVHPAAFIVGRLYEPHQEFESDPERSGRDFADRVLAERVNELGLYNAWESFNERIISSHPKELYEKYDRFQVAFAQRLRERYPELEAVAMNFATGNLADRDFVEYFPRTLETHKYLGFHEYDWPTMWRLHEQGLKDGNEGMWLCLKYRRFMREVRKEYGDKHVAIITECGMTQAVHPGRGDVGWRTELSEEQYWESLKWYNDRLCEDEYVMGCCIFVVGGTSDWATFETLGPTIDRMAALPKTIPDEVPPPEEHEPAEVPETEISTGPTPTPLPATLTISSITIPSYPYEDYLQDEYNSIYNMTFKRLDWGAYAGAPKTVTERTFTALIVENEYLRLTVLPELGGRIYQCIFKPTGHNQFYQNPVLKPTRWGPPEQGWWLAAGGTEWGLPVEEHGYETAMPWTYTTVTASDGVTVTVQDSTADDRLRARIDIYLPSGKSYFAVRLHIENPTGSPFNYKYWINAMLAPGGTNQPSGQLEFILPVDQVTVHTRDERWEELPGGNQPMSWPVHKGFDLSIYGHWPHYLGFFERPAAQEDFMGLYEHSVGEGMVRVYPSAVAQGSKAFGFGYGSGALAPELWTDGDSAYVELHGGVAPTFADSAFLGPGESINWSEFWYPVKDIGGFVYANREAALNLEVEGGQATIGVATTAPHSASQIYLRRCSDGALLFHEVIPYLTPAQPYRSGPVAVGGLSLDDLSLVYADVAGEIIAAYQYTGPSPTPTSPTSTLTTLAQEVRALDEQLRKLESLLDTVIKQLAG